MTPDWRNDAACKGMDPDLFFPEKGRVDEADEARAVCADCPVAAQCLSHGLNERWGIWGGSVPLERKRARVKRLRDRQSLGPAAVIFDRLRETA